MPQPKFSPAKQVVKTQKITVEPPVGDYAMIRTQARNRKVSTREFIRLATMYAMENLETQ